MQKDFDSLLTSLLEETEPVEKLPLDHFSDLSQENSASLHEKWQTIPENRRIKLLQELGDREAIQFDLDFSRVYLAGLDDPHPQAAALSIRNLSEIEYRGFLPSLLLLARHQSEIVRSAAAAALGHFVYLGELDELPEDQSSDAVKSLFDLFHSDEDSGVRCAALESLGYSGDEQVPSIILRSLESENISFSVSAMKAIGRSADASWKPRVLENLGNLHPEIRLESVRAAGELEIREAFKDLVELLDDVDRQIRLAAIWSIAQIGGDTAEALLSHLLSECEDVEEADLLEDALDLLEFNAGLDNFLIFDLDEDSENLEEEF